MILSDGDIGKAVLDGDLGIVPFEEKLVQPASYDVRLSSIFLAFDNMDRQIDPREPGNITYEIEVKDDDFFVIYPGEFILASTVERFSLPPNICGMLGGKSSLARLGLQIHTTAGFIDPGFCGQVTLELSNVARLPIRLYPNMRIAQMVFSYLREPSQKPYGHADLGSKYMGQCGPTESQYYKNDVA